MWPSKVANILNKIIGPPSWWCVALGALALAIIMLTVVVDVTIRTIFSKTLPGNIDIIRLVLVIVFFSAYAYLERGKRHIQINVLVGRLPVTAQRVITTNGYFLAIGIMALTSWQIYKQSEFLRISGIYTGVLRIPEWPFIALASFFVVIFTLALLRSFLYYLSELLTAKGVKAYFWLLPGIILALVLFGLSMQPSLLPFELTRGTWGISMFIFLFVLIFLNVHIGIVMALLALVGLSYISGPEAALSSISFSALDIASKYTWSVAPLFMWMGLLAMYAGFAKELYETAYKWVGHIPGGLASTNVVACTGLGAITGDPATGILTMGVMGLPEMKAHKYDMKLSTASICAASSIGTLIPPSMTFIVYGMLTEVSIAKLFMAGILPGILFAAILILLITIRCVINPKLGPPGGTSTWKEKVVSLKNIWAVVLLVIFVLGSLYMGIVTPTEAGAIGAFGAIVIGLARRRLPLKGLIRSVTEAVELVGIVFFIFVFAIAFTRFLTATRLPYDLAEWVTGLGLVPIVLIGLILLIYMFLGMVMNALPVIIITVPIFFPLVMAAGFDSIWFGVLIVCMANLGGLTPPIGMLVFVMSAVAPDVPIYDIFRGVLPFWGAYVLLVIILVLFPQISLFLPSLM